MDSHGRSQGCFFTIPIDAPHQQLQYSEKMGNLHLWFVDDIYRQGDTFDKCQQNVWITTAFLRSLGFTINVEKSILIPTQLMVYAVFRINTIQMTLQITEGRADKIVTLCIALLNNTNPTIREVAK